MHQKQISYIYYFILLLFFLLLGGKYSYANNTITNTPEFKKLYEQKKYNDLWNLIKDVDDFGDGNLLFTKGSLLASGVISSGANKCLAVEKFEKVEELGGIYARSSLNYLYEGNWTALASLEGSRVALFRKAQKIVSLNPPLFLLGGKKEKENQIILAMKLLNDSIILGYEDGRRMFDLLKNDNPELSSKLNLHEKRLFFKPKKIICPVRNYY